MPEVITLLGCPAAIKTFENLAYQADVEVNGKMSYTATVITPDGEASYTIWYSPKGQAPVEELGVFILSPKEKVGSAGGEGFTYVSVEEDTSDPTKAVLQWLAPGEDGDFMNQENMECVEAKIAQ
uniref:Uncharacterized protein n=1 Tax=Noctiluca scintillans TaxID=2966 RepID=A0A7S1A812_NOCSC|eukprot:CAMPEP_0194481848 /NCGR_PEP_ID=MMETSP0253-20130528/4078_1 /TAXON_ID=2966 /ORGANISM="Noctiluca scintillans" /LENGTH=124 /DNA_ID=CAMNT_0039321355 /DNA_START=53 /DNA_END=427 /DNA_ORIENTATION=+